MVKDGLHAQQETNISKILKWQITLMTAKKEL
jgi:hypothetical protein